ncbi:hypothetical protein VNO77_19143 [Canavalia gladiata]|uniref:Uncharacterized protein n=1 Tax=Canavalia gladiata TaxID=3824 RepID=A0AAN9LLX1_CANGL
MHSRPHSIKHFRGMVLKGFSLEFYVGMSSWDGIRRTHGCKHNTHREVNRISTYYHLGISVKRVYWGVSGKTYVGNLLGVGCDDNLFRIEAQEQCYELKKSIGVVKREIQFTAGFGFSANVAFLLVTHSHLSVMLL